MLPFLKTLLTVGAASLLAASAFGSTQGPAPQPNQAQAPASLRKFRDATALEWSQRMASSEISRLGNKLERGATPRSRWDYTASVFALSVWQLGERLNDKSLLDFAGRAVGSYVTPEGTIDGYRLEEYNIDQVCPGKVVLELYDTTKEEKYRRAAMLLRDQMKSHPRTSDGGFWHKKRYPFQMWLDGLYMASPFLAQYGQIFNEPDLHNEVCHQILLMDKHGFSPAKSAHMHAWDEKKIQPWADRQTGLSPNLWSRSIGWYAMAMVDSLDFIPATNENIDLVVNALRRTADSIAKYQDPATGLWWQVTDAGNRKGNYLEASASSMFVYALAKGINRGYLPRDVFEPVVLKGYEGLVRDMIRVEANGSVSLTQTCLVAGLGYTTQSGRPRDGSFDYYVSEPIIDNDHKGVGPFIMAGIEVEALVSSASIASVERVTGWDYADKILARIKAPVFPQRSFPITSFGAVQGKDCTEAIANAIAECNKAGGGTVLVPAGEWLTGAVHLLSNVNLHVSEGATLKWVFDLDKYPIVHTRWEGVECMNFSPFIYAMNAENIAITGLGTLDGGASYDTWWAWNNKKDGTVLQKKDRDQLIAYGEKGVPVAERVFGKGHYLRPSFIQPYKCRNILIEGVKIVNSPMWEITPVLSSNITVRGVEIVTHGPNNDGCDPESCRDVLIENCIFDTGDDCIAIKSGRNNDGRRINVPSENFVIRNCTMKDGHGGVVIGSEISGGCRNVFVENCVMDSPNLDRALRFKSNASRGGTLENVFMRNVKVGAVAEAVLTIDLLYEEGARGSFPPTVRNIVIEKVTSTASPRVMFIRSFTGATIDGIRFSDCTFSGVREAEVLQGAGNISLRNVNIIPAKGVKSANSVAQPVEP